MHQSSTGSNRPPELEASRVRSFSAHKTTHFLAAGTTTPLAPLDGAATRPGTGARNPFPPLWIAAVRRRMLLQPPSPRERLVRVRHGEEANQAGNSTGDDQGGDDEDWDQRPKSSSAPSPSLSPSAALHAARCRAQESGPFPIPIRGKPHFPIAALRIDPYLIGG